MQRIGGNFIGGQTSKLDEMGKVACVVVVPQG